MKKLVIVPTYNELENIGNLVPDLLGRYPEIHILVVDDNSPDGTGDIVRGLMESHSRVHLLSRPGKQGLGRAYLAGFSWAMENGFDAVVEMDADFSHRPQDLELLLKNIEEKDFVIGSRYIPGGRTVNWGFIRKLISRGGSLYTRMILGYPLNDWTGGFNAWTRATLESIDLSRVKSEGYCFQIELKYRAVRSGQQGIEVPIVFEDRRAGQSKMSFRIVLEAFYRVWFLRFL